MGDKTSLGDRMKENYENRTRYKLTRRTPVIIRLDGKAFHTYTKGCDKPFDESLIEDMMETTRFLCENIMGIKCGYTQSDEISLLITDFDKLETQAWFDYNLQKMCSISASLATAKFNSLRKMRLFELNKKDKTFDAQAAFVFERELPLAFFDARVFQISEYSEVVNYFIWRQRDAEKNSIAMLAQSLYSHKELHKKNGSDMQEMCFQKGHNWNDLHYSKKRGSFVKKITRVNDKIPSDPLFKETDPVYGDIIYQPHTKDGLYPNKLGRLLEFGKSEHGWDDWCDVPIEKVRTKWEDIETPIFSKSRESILNLIKKDETR